MLVPKPNGKVKLCLDLAGKDEKQKLTQSRMMQNGQNLFRKIDLILEMVRNTQKKKVRNG